jgi:hypothetical protein
MARMCTIGFLTWGNDMLAKVLAPKSRASIDPRQKIPMSKAFRLNDLPRQGGCINATLRFHSTTPLACQLPHLCKRCLSS